MVAGDSGRGDLDDLDEEDAEEDDEDDEDEDEDDLGLESRSGLRARSGSSGLPCRKRVSSWYSSRVSLLSLSARTSSAVSLAGSLLVSLSTTTSSLCSTSSSLSPSASLRLRSGSSPSRPSPEVLLPWDPAEAASVEEPASGASFFSSGSGRSRVRIFSFSFSSSSTLPSVLPPTSW
eukprot:TRINITY_DN65626_c10_g1_i2.p1 TRINITY_DN65626_c10_g1~~TRINITY_DN65626_c10_g1_i2.p1  ORF type:complete len:177 (+),score=46.44 TRINITY_DN65626_c10_g1_i2:199-729(+)